DVVVLCTSSSIAHVLPQIEAVLKTRTPIVSTTEELSYPGYTHLREARRIHALARKAKGAVLGTGGNPGLAMDAPPVGLTAGGRLRTRRPHRREPHPGCEHPPAAVSTEDRRRADEGAVPEESRRRQRAPRRVDGVDRDDRGRDGLDARAHHGRDRTEDGRRR